MSAAGRRGGIRAGYITISLDEASCDVFYEEAGDGPVLLCLHTAGADSRQYHDLLVDEGITRRWRVVAFDLPCHGRSEPPDRWWEEEYILTTERYARTIRAVIEALDLAPATVLGCSMGGSIVLELARRPGAAVRAVIGMQGASRVHGRFLDWSIRPDLNGATHVAQWIYGLMAPQSPLESRKRVAWIYSQGAPGIYRGDTYFYAEDWDFTGREAQIDTNRCPVVLMSGEYDYACPPAATQQTAARIPGASFVPMRGVGHFPMVENYPVFRRYLIDALESVRGSG